MEKDLSQDISYEDANELLEEDGKMMEDENNEIIKIDWKCYKKYFGRYWNGCTFLVLGNLSMVGYMASWMAGDYLVGNWTTQLDQRTNFKYYASLSLTFAIVTSLCITCRVSVMLYHCWHAGKQLHSEMIQRIVHAPVNLYFDVTPIGKSLNKFSKDLNQLEVGLGYQCGSMLAQIYNLL